MEFCYAAVLRKDIPLVQHCPQEGNFDLFFQRYVDKHKLENGKTILILENFLWGILQEEEGLIYICVLKGTNDDKTVEKAVEDIKSRFIRAHGNDWRKAAPFGLQTSFEPQLILVKHSLLSFTGNLSPPSHIGDLDDDSTGSPLLADDDVHSDFDSSLTDVSLVIKPPQILNKHINIKPIIGWIIIFLICAVIIYTTLALICGGFDLSPRCL